jgi:hypothetical protein
MPTWRRGRQGIGCRLVGLALLVGGQRVDSVRGLAYLHQYLLSTVTPRLAVFLSARNLVAGFPTLGSQP